MAGTVAVIRKDEEENKNNSDDEDQFPNRDAAIFSPGCSASPPLASLNECKGSLLVPERLSVLSSKAVAQIKALTGQEMISCGQTQRIASRLSEHHLTAVDTSLDGLSYSVAVRNLKSVGIASLCSKSPCCNDEPNLDVLHFPTVPCEASETPQSGSDPEDCHTDRSGMRGDMASCGLGHVILMKTTKVMETLENKKQEEKEKYRLQLAMYRRLLLLRSIRSLHRQLEQQQARLQECYGMVINTKKEVLKHICSTSPSPSL